MRAKEFTSINMLSEGVGLARRKPGELFKNSQGDTLTFQNLQFFPTVGKFNSSEELEQAKATAGVDSNTKWTNNPTKDSLAFAIATFKDSADADVVLGRYFKDIKANRNDNKFPHDAIPGNYVYNSKEGAKENAGYKPSQVLTTFEKHTPQTIVEQIVAKFGAGSDEAIAAETFLNASSFPVTVPKGAMNFEAFKIYFCEMLQPIALVKGMKVTGNAQDAVDIFFGKGVSLTNCTIKFNDSTGGVLSDSVLVNPDGKELKISTKDAVGGGAKASAQNILKCVEELQMTSRGLKILEKHQGIVMKILDAFKGQAKKDDPTQFDGKTHFTAPLEICMLANLITEEEASQVINLKEMQIGLGEDIVGQGIVSKKLEGWYSEYLAKWKKAVVPIHTMMLILAYKATQYVNEKTNFSSSASDILNNSALIQVYNDVVPSDKNFIIRGMNAVYPSTAVTGVKLTTEKAYWTTGAQGNMTFKVLYNGESAGTSTIGGDSGADNSPKSTAPAAQAPAVAPPQQLAPVQNNTATTTSVTTATDELSQIRNLAGINPGETPGIVNQKRTLGNKIPMGSSPATV
jgi:hypothetical protein